MNLAAIDDWGIPSTLLEDMGVLLEGVQPDDAILMWPVTVLGQRESDGVDLHVTLNWGRWDGTEEELRAAVVDVLTGESLKIPRFTQWVPAIFQGKEKKFLVMQLPEVQAFVVKLRKKVADVFQDRFGDGYMPHISVSQSLYDHINNNKITPREAEVKVGDLELRLGDKILDTLSESVIAEGRYSLPASQKMVLRDMASNSRRWRDWPGGFYVPEGEERSRDQERLFSTYVLWPVMRSLLAKGMIEQTAKKGIRYFSITAKGEEEMARG
jgi:hypothetical protein